MHIPIKVDYGVRALVDLGLHREAEPIRASEIARRTAIPEPYLAQVLHSLNKYGLIQSYRGPQGGHALAKEPSEIRLSMVMECLGGAETLVGCLGDVNMCIHVPSCAQREVWQRVDQAVYGILDSTSISDLVARTELIAAVRGSVAPVSRVEATVV